MKGAVRTFRNLGFLAALLAAPPIAAPPIAAPPIAAQEAGGAAEGEAIYERECAACHAPGGFAPPPAAFADLSADAFGEAMAAHPDVGEAVSNLSGDEIRWIHDALAAR